MAEENEDETEKAAAAADAGGESEEDEGGGLDAKKIVLFFVLPLFILAGIGGGLFVSGALDSFFEKSDAVEEVRRPDPSEVVFLKIPDILVNLSSPEGQPRYLRLSVQLELKSQRDMEDVEKIMPRVIDQFQTYLREMRVQDLRGSAGIYRLQMELLSRVNSAAYPVEVQDVLFQEILIQ